MDIENSTEQVKEVMKRAIDYSYDNNLVNIGLESILYGLYETSCMPRYIMKIYNSGKEFKYLFLKFRPKIYSKSVEFRVIDNSRALNRVISKINMQGAVTDTMTLFYGILKEIQKSQEIEFNTDVEELLIATNKYNSLNYVATKYLSGCKYYSEQIIRREDNLKIYDEFISKISVNNKVLNDFAQNMVISEEGNYVELVNKEYKNLSKYATNISKMAIEGKLGKVIGREEELQRVISIMCKLKKNNPVILGEAGIGKTALVEKLASYIANGDVPDKLKDKVIYNLNLAGVVAGTKYRGDLEQKIMDIIDEIRNNTSIVLFIDEIHVMCGLGKNTGDTDGFDNIIKPYIARGEICIIGATTLNEYKKSIEKDAALARRFQPVIMKEPTKSETFEILKGVRREYEEYHEIKITDEILNYVVELTEKYVSDRNFPDKALDIIDEASAICTEEYLSKKDIAKIIYAWKGILVKENNSLDFQDIKEELFSKVVGQDKVINKIIDVISLANLGIINEGRPRASFILVGKTGVGKTYISKLLASSIFKFKESFIRLNMSEYMEPHTTSKIIGSPPGYVGFDSTVGLAEKVRRNPYSLILFDEIDKAHPDVLNLLLQILDEGELTDSNMRNISFKQTIIILTANSCSYKSYSKSLGFESLADKNDEKELISAMRREIGNEIFDRVDSVIVMNDFEREDKIKIIQMELSKIISALRNQEYNIDIQLDSLAYDYIIDKFGKEGARQISRYISNDIGKLICEKISLVKKEEPKKFTLSYDKEEKIVKLWENESFSEQDRLCFV